MLQLALAKLQPLWQGRSKRLVLGFLVAFFLLMLASGVLLPVYLKGLAIEQAQAQIGRKLEIGELSFSPFRLALTAKDLSLFEPDRKTPALTIQSVVLNVSLSSLFQRALVVDQVLLDQPSVHLLRTSAQDYGHYNFSDILERIAAMPKSAETMRFFLANLQLKDGKIQFDDQVLAQQIQVDALQIGVPFLSNFPSEVQSFVQPSLSARINGGSFSLKGRSKPFQASRETSLAIDASELDLAKYVAYLPVALPVQLASAKLSSKLDLSFSQKNQGSEILLSGELQLGSVFLQDKTSQPLLKVQKIQTQIRQWNLLSGAASIDKLLIEAPEAWLALDTQGKTNWPYLNASAENQEAGSKTSPTNAPPVYAISEFLLQKGIVHLNDALFAQPAKSTSLTGLQLTMRQFSTAPAAKSATFVMGAQAEPNQSLQLEGELHPESATMSGKIALDALSLAEYQAYANRYLAADLAGWLSLKSQVSFKSGAFQADGLTAQLKDFRLDPKTKGQGGLALKTLQLENVKLDSASRNLDVGNIAISGLNADIRRLAGPQARLNLQNLLLPSTAASGSAAAPGSPAHKDQADWRVVVQKLALDDSSLAFTDQSLSAPVSIKADGIAFSAEHLSSDLSQSMNLQWSSSINRQGRLSLDGNATPQLRQISLNLDGKTLPLAALSPYFSHLLNVQLTRGHASAKGKLSLRNLMDSKQDALQWLYEGMLSLNDFHVVENGATEDFLEWKSINLEGIHASMGAGKQLVSLRKLGLNDFYARLILSENGKLNLRNILVQNAPAPQPAAATGAPLAKSDPLQIRIGQTVLKGGNINFTDNFIKPNYSANLTGVSGIIGAVASDKAAPANIELTGKIDDDAPLVISGNINPLSAPISLDIKASASGIELTRLTPYAAKYAGYAIEKGKLSMQTSYRVENDKLQAENELKLDQLTFGERIDNPDATKLPVLLAVALLRDNNGQIAINLPISGSLSDPEFSVGGIIAKVLGNLILKAVTAPFSFLGALFGGGEELAYVEFAAGQTALTPAAKLKLDNLAKALKNRSGLRLDITGRVDPVSDADGLRAARLDKKIRALKWRDLRQKEQSGRPEDLTLDDAERKKYMTEVYKDEKFAKPKNLLGMNKSLPPEEAQKLILSNTKIDQDDLRQLAQDRADSVLDYLEKDAGVSRAQLFLIAPKLHVEGIVDKAAPNRVDFSLK